MSALAQEAPHTEHVLLTVHGPGYGLDEMEAFKAEIAGLVDAFRENDRPHELQRVTFIEHDTGRAKRLDALIGLLPDPAIAKPGSTLRQMVRSNNETLRAAGYSSNAKDHVFVAMPFKIDMDDTYHYGVQRAANAAGFLCERADLSIFTGEVLEWVRSRIRSASLVVADLTDSNPERLS